MSPGTLSCHLCYVPSVQVVDAAGFLCRWHLLWGHIVPAASRNQQLGFSAPLSSWLLGLSPRTGELWGQREKEEIKPSPSPCGA